MAEKSPEPSKEKNYRSNHSNYPRTYVVAKGWKIVFLISGAFLLIMSPIMLHDFTTARHGQVDWVRGLTGLLMIPWGIACCLVAVKHRVVLDADSVEVQGLFSKGLLRYDEIAGRRMNASQDMIVLIPKDANKKKLKISVLMQFDPEFESWVTALHDFDRDEMQRGSSKGSE